MRGNLLVAEEPRNDLNGPFVQSKIAVLIGAQNYGECRRVTGVGTASRLRSDGSVGAQLTGPAYSVTATDATCPL
jgi:hypothetical protein